MAFFVYILASKRNGTFYIGMADDLVKRFGRRQELDSRLRGNERLWRTRLLPIPLVPAEAGTQT
jgi:predicted GIY-YIG superfamily endonuclease